MYTAVGRVEEAGRRVTVLEEMAGSQRVPPYVMMRAWMALDPDRACDYLELAYKERDPRLTHAAVSPVFDSLRASPRFEVVLRAMGLAAEIVLTWMGCCPAAVAAVLNVARSDFRI